MPDIEIHRAHELGLKGARAAADAMAETLGRKFDLKGTWQGNVLRFERTGVTGSLSISEKTMELAVTLGFLLKAMKSSIESAVKHELDRVLEAPPSKPAPKPKKAPPRAKKAGP